MKNCKINELWCRFWMNLAGIKHCRLIGTIFVQFWSPPFLEKPSLANYNKRGFISTHSTKWGVKIKIGDNVFIDDRVVIFQDSNSGNIEIGNRVHLLEGTLFRTGNGGGIKIGDDTHIGCDCQFSGYKETIEIGRFVNIESRCAFYPYDHGMIKGISIGAQSLVSKGPIIVEDQAYIGSSVIVLSGVKIGRKAIIKTGSIVTTNVPNNAIAFGKPAKILGYLNS